MIDEDLPELASLSNRFSYFENFKEDQKTGKKKRGDGEEVESDMARRECKAKSVLSKFKEMEDKVLKGESDGKC